MERRIFSTDEDKTSLRHNRTSVAGDAQFLWQPNVLKRRILAEFRPVTKGFCPSNLHFVQVQRGQLSVWRFRQRYAIRRYCIHVEDIAAPIRIDFGSARIRGRRIGPDNSRKMGKVGGLDVQNASFWIESAAAPICAADYARAHDGALVGRRSE